MLDDSKCQEQGVCTGSNPFGQVVRTRKACRALLTDAVWLPMYWCINGGGRGGGGREGKQCQGRPTTYCGANLMCLPKKEPFVCVRGAAETAGRTCASLDAAGFPPSLRLSASVCLSLSLSLPLFASLLSLSPRYLSARKFPLFPLDAAIAPPIWFLRYVLFRRLYILIFRLCICGFSSSLPLPVSLLALQLK
jgi:hypothetical protein